MQIESMVENHLPKLLEKSSKNRPSEISEQVDGLARQY